MERERTAPTPQTLAAVLTARLDPPGGKADDMIARALRVDHAGEHGAVRIYEGQLAVLSATRRTARSARLVAAMKAGEQRHLDEFDRRLADAHVRPTLLQPIWHVAGFALGAATALLSERAAMACTQAVETVIDEHYAAQSLRLRPIDPALADVVDEFRADEAEHRETAVAEGAEQAPFYRLLSGAVRAGCRLAISLSERIRSTSSTRNPPICRAQSRA